MSDVECDELGCGDAQVYAFDRCGAVEVCALDSVAGLQYGRIMDDTSNVVINIALSGGSDEAACCECLGELRSWLHTIVIVRNDEVVWGPGPIVDLLYTSDEVIITARDVSAWLDVRVIREELKFVDTPALEVARSLIAHAMLPDDPCGVLKNVVMYESETPTLITQTYDAGSLYVGDALRELARTVLDFTVVGNSILLGEPLEWGPFETYTDEDFQQQMEIQERGIESGTKWYVRGETELGQAGGVDPYLGLIEQLVIEEGIETEAQLTQAARNRVQASNPPPVYVNVPEGARLSPTSPMCFAKLVPGTLFVVDLNNLCRSLLQQYHLTAVSVSIGGDGNESVGVTLSPIGTNFSEGT